MDHQWDGIDRRIDKIVRGQEQSDLLVLSERFQALHDDGIFQASCRPSFS